jgi:hypothetical protein
MTVKKPTRKSINAGCGPALLSRRGIGGTEIGRLKILGALAVPIEAQDKLLPPKSIGEPPSPDCLIKGNVNPKGERIYHLPGSSTYAKIRMDRPQRRWFCSEAEAKAAGWRPAKGAHVGMPAASAKSHNKRI